MDGDHLQLPLDSRLDEIDRLADAIAAFCGRAGFAAEVSAFTLCAEELFTNIVVHGHAGASGHRIDVVIRRDGNRLLIEIVDDGPPFDPTASVAVDLDASVEERPIGGLGRHLVSTLMERFCYRRDGKYNRVLFGRLVGLQGER